MKPAIARIAFFSFLLSLFIPCLTYAESKTFIKEYSYQASEDDSRNSSRVIALREVKRLLLEELGTYLESQTEVKNFQLTKDQITTLTAGIVQTKIVAEKWDGSVYWLKSRITADSDKVIQSINALRKDRDKTRELESMRLKADELMAEVERLRKAMAKKDATSDAKKTAYDQSIRELSAAEWIERGHAAKDAAGSIKAYSQAIELDPANMKAHYFRARIGEEAQAMSDYYQVLSIPAKDSEGHLIRAWTYWHLKKRDPALLEFGKAIERARANKEQAFAYFERGRYYNLIKPRPYTPPSAMQLPNAVALANRDFSSAIKLDPTDPSYYQHRAFSFMDLRLHDFAIDDYTAGISLDPKREGLYSARGEVYQGLQKHDLAIADFSKAIELEGPEDFFAPLDYENRASSYEALGKFDLAIRDLKTIQEIRPKGPSKMPQIAELYGKLGRYDQAIACYDKAAALKLGKYDARRVYYGRALAYAAKGNAGKAMGDLRRAVQLDPGYKAIARSDQGFASLRNHPDFIKLTGGN